MRRRAPLAPGERPDVRIAARLAELRADAKRQERVKERRRCPVCQCTGGCRVVVLDEAPGRPEPLMEGLCVPVGVVGLPTCSACLA